MQPNLEKDSALLASRPVHYSNERPLMYRSARDMVERALFMSAEDVANALLRSLIYTKSLEWEYEGEFRLAIPRFVPQGASAAYLDLYPDELSRVYFGCRVTDEQRRELEGLARTLNSDCALQPGRNGEARVCAGVGGRLISFRRARGDDPCIRPAGDPR